MKKLLAIFFLLSYGFLSAQSPNKINYQSIIRDLAGNVIQNQPISLRISIISDSINGTIVYQETFQPTTNNFGLVNIKIGEGTTVIATMSSVDWSNGPFFLESAVDVTGGTNYIVVSTSQFMSVPYALYAKESPLDTMQVQNIVNQQTNNFLDSTSIQNMIDSSVLNIDSTLIASWGYIDSNSIMILINNNSLDSTTIQNMIDNSIVNIDSSTVASWGYLDSSTIQILINNSTIDSSSVSNWGYLDSTTIQNIIIQQTNNYLDSTTVQNMIDNSVTNIDSSTVASWGYVDSNSIMILINNNSLDSAAVQNMINSSITNVDSSTVASWGYLDSSSIIALISNSNIDSSSVASWGYLDSVSIQNMINNSSVNVDSTMIANFGFVAGPHTIDTDTQIDSTGIANYGFVTSSQVLDSSSVQNMINNSTSNVDSSTVASWGYLDSNSILNIISQYSGVSLGAFGDYQDLILNFNIVNSNGGTNDSYYSGTTSDPMYVSQEKFSNKDLFLLIDACGNGNNAIFLFLSENPNQFTTPEKLRINANGSEPKVIPIPKEKYWRIESKCFSSSQTFQILEIISDSSLNSGSSSIIDSTTISNMGFVDSMTVVNMINSIGGGSGGFNFIDPVYLFYTSTQGYGGRHPNSELVYNAGNPNNPPGYKESIYGSITKVNPITNNISPNGSDSLLINFDSILGNHYDNILCYYDVGGEGNSSNSPFIFSMIYESDGFKYPLIRDYLNTSSSITASKQASGNLIIRNSNTGKINLYYTLSSNSFNTDVHMDLVVIGYNNSGSNTGSGSNSVIDSTTVANWGFSTDTDTQIDSAGIAALGYVAGPHTIDTDTQIDSAGVAAMGYLDSVSIRNMIDSMVAQSISSSSTGSGISFNYPDGFSGMTPITISNDLNTTAQYPGWDHSAGTVDTIYSKIYTPPANKKLYITNFAGSIPQIANASSNRYYLLPSLEINNLEILEGPSFMKNPLIIGSDDTLKINPEILADQGLYIRWYPSSINGFLVNSNVEVDPISHKFNSTYHLNDTYSVPNGKTLVILNIKNPSGGTPGGLKVSSASASMTNLNGVYNTPDYNTSLSTLRFVREFPTLSNPIFVGENEVLSVSSSPTVINGYLVDKDFFESSSSSSGSGSGSSSGTNSNANSLIFTTNGF